MWQAPIAQLVERLTFNEDVHGSSPCGRTTSRFGTGSFPGIRGKVVQICNIYAGNGCFLDLMRKVRLAIVNAFV